MESFSFDWQTAGITFRNIALGLAGLLGSLKIGDGIAAYLKGKAESHKIRKQADVEALTKTVKVLQGTLEDSDNRGDQMADRLTQVESRLEILHQEKLRLQSKIAELETQIAQQNMENHGLQLQLSEFKLALEKANREICQLQSQLKQRDKRINELIRNPPGSRELAK